MERKQESKTLGRSAGRKIGIGEMAGGDTPPRDEGRWRQRGSRIMNRWKEEEEEEEERRRLG